VRAFSRFDALAGQLAGGHGRCLVEQIALQHSTYRTCAMNKLIATVIASTFSLGAFAQATAPAAPAVAPAVVGKPAAAPMAAPAAAPMAAAKPEMAKKDMPAKKAKAKAKKAKQAKKAA
jgi:hypothetical protein